jgi:LSD1 subclass zinc finger protein
MICHAHHDITAGDVLQADAEMTCKHCAAPVAYPAGAARVRCTGCGLFLLGQDLDDAQCEEMRITEGLARLALRETYLAAKRRAEGGPGREDPPVGYPR